jgi:hypothetical protein
VTVTSQGFLGARRLILLSITLGLLAVGVFAACDETGPSPVGVHPNTPLDAGTDTGGDTDAAADGEAEGGDAEVDGEVDGGTDAGEDAADAADG